MENMAANTVVSSEGLYGSRSYALKERLDHGGEGDVYRIGDGKLAKIYHSLDSSEMERQERKIRYMIAHPAPWQDTSGRVIAAWPQEMLFKDGDFVGLTMPEVTDAQPIYKLYRGDKKAEAVVAGYDWSKAIVVAANLAGGVAALHRSNVVIGDMNDKNLLVNPEGWVSIIDADSFDIREGAAGMRHRCRVARGPYRPSELQGIDLKEDTSEGLTIHTDEFALAIHIFQLLSGGQHPFRAEVLAKEEDSASTAPKENNIELGRSPYFECSSDCAIPHKAPDLGKLLPRYIVEDFQRAFKYRLDPMDEHYVLDCRRYAEYRTTAQSWYEDLVRLLDEVKDGKYLTCEKGLFHWRAADDDCVFCAAEIATERKDIKKQEAGDTEIVSPAKKGTSAAMYFILALIIILILGILFIMFLS